MQHITPFQYSLLLRLSANLPPSTPSAPWGNNPALPFTDLHTLESFLVVQGWPSTLTTNRPKHLCSKTPCPSHVQWLMSLEWRASYKPWSVTPSLLSEASAGWLYTRGSTAGVPQPIIWYRPGLHKVSSEPAYLRNIVYTLDRAAASATLNGLSLAHLGKKARNDPRRYYVVLDATDFSLSQVPSMGAVKEVFKVVGDNFPRRLSKLAIVNCGRGATFFWRMVGPMLQEDVREKIVIVGGKESAVEALKGDIGMADIPIWLGGGDEWEWDAVEYYGGVTE